MVCFSPNDLLSNDLLSHCRLHPLLKLRAADGRAKVLGPKISFTAIESAAFSLQNPLEKSWRGMENLEKLYRLLLSLWKSVAGWYNGSLRAFLFLGIMFGALWSFFEIADEVGENESRKLDETVVLLFRNQDNLSDPIGPKWLEEAARDVTALGSYTIIGFATVYTAVFLLLANKRREALYSVLAVASGVALTHALKMGFARPRPDLVPHFVQVSTASFPSGHSSAGALAYLSITLLAAQAMPSKKTKAFAMGMSFFVAFLIAVSRVYLGVHWPSDVLGGLSLGVFWAFLWASFLSFSKKN